MLWRSGRDEEREKSWLTRHHRSSARPAPLMITLAGRVDIMRRRELGRPAAK